MRIIVGLGNPGDRYKFTRHNVGFLVVEKMCQKLGVDLDKKKFNGEYTKVDDLIIARPTTYMNNSGDFISALCAFFKVSPDDVMVIHDEKDFQLGQSSLKIGGSDAGHNGIKSVIDRLGSNVFKRMRIGIGKNPHIPLRDYVLQNFTPAEMATLEPVLEVAADAAISFAFNDINTLMNSFNTKRKNIYNEK